MERTEKLMKNKLHKDLFDSHMTTNNSILNLLCLFKCEYKIHVCMS